MRRLVLALMLLAAPAAADEPSFDCDKAAAPVEHLICADSALVRLDALMGQTFGKRRSAASEAQRKTLLADQRDWLKARLERCGIAAKGGQPDESQTWTWAPCLAEQYRERLADLGVKEPAPSLPAGVVHPLCLSRAVGSLVGDDGPRPTALEACHRAHRHIAVERGEDGSWTAAKGGVSPESVSYRVVGPLAGGAEAVLVNYWGGGTGQFSGLYKLTRKGDTLSGEVLVEGGDRCNRGLANATVVDGKTLRVEMNAGPVDFIALARPDLEEKADGMIMNCAICCYAVATLDYTPGKKTGTLVQAEIVPENQPDDDEAFKCLNRVVGIKKGKALTVSAEEAGKAAARFVKECRKP